LARLDGHGVRYGCNCQCALASTGKGVNTALQRT
jgi:hypothetical protein